LAHILLNGGDLQRAGRTWSTLKQASLSGLLTAALLLLGAGARADDTEWRDLESRIQYSYYTEDARTLQKLEDELATNESHGKLKSYYVALNAWRQGQLAARNAAAAKTAASALQRCVHELDASLEAQPDVAEALALRAGCANTAQAGGGLHVPFTGPKPARDIQRALELAPRNPRVLLIDAMIDYLAAASSGGNRERALPKLRHAVAAFEVERGGAEPVPGWGAAEAYVYLGRDLLDHGDGVGARDALEHALLLAPDYQEARRLMAKIASG
jgi:hypothetical protein